MDYKKEYEQAIERAKGIYNETIVPTPTAKGTCEYIFPELKDSDDDRIRKALIQYLKDYPNLPNGNYCRDDFFAWLEKQGEKVDAIENFNTEFERQISHLIASTINKEHEYNEGFVKWTANALLNYAKHELEKQGEHKCDCKYVGCHVNNVKRWCHKKQSEILYEKCNIKCSEYLKKDEQKPNDKVESKFKVGDWIINSIGTLRHIVAVDKTGYETDKGWLTHDYYENCFHLWTIKDAKDGDVLTTKNFIFIFKNIDSDNGVRYYCHYEISNYEADDLFEVAFPQCVMGRVGNGLSYYSPATEEQCDLLFSKMKESGYEWDSEKKELRKIGQKPEINDDVLSRFAFYQYDNEILYLSSVFVEERSRKHGYGSKILKAAEEVAKTLGISKIRLKVETNSWMEEWYKRNGYEYLTSEGKYDWLEKHGEQKPQVNSALEVWKNMRLEVYQQASGNRHEPNYSDDRTKMFSLTDIDEIFEKVAEKQNVTDIISDLENYFATTTKEQQEKDWEEIKKWEEKHFNHDRHIEINLTNKIEPKFKVGDWLVYEENIYQIHNISLKKYYECLRIDGTVHTFDFEYIDSKSRLWTIQDAKDGDVLYHKSPLTGIEYIVMSKGINGFGNIDSYFRYNSEDGFGTYIPSVFNAKSDDITPATKEQRDFLFQEMKEAGYEWDNKKKELRKIEQKPAFCHHEVDLSGCSEEYRKAYYDGWNNCNQQHSQLKAEHKPAWSEKDEEYLQNMVEWIGCFIDDEVCGDMTYKAFYMKRINWLKSLKERYGWKPTDEQMKQLGWIAEQNKDNMIGKELMSLYQDLKKLKGE